MVTLNRIYTRTGDGGKTRLSTGEAVSKASLRVEAYGGVDELNAALGMARLQTSGDAQLDPILARVQNDLFDLGADVSVPTGDAKARLRVRGEQTAWLEARCDEVNGTLAPLKSFVIPGGTAAAAQLHICRTVCRRAERRMVAVDPPIDPVLLRYVNRLSDLLFVLARVVNHRGGVPETEW